jgi:hypothetical protein
MSFGLDLAISVGGPQASVEGGNAMQRPTFVKEPIVTVAALSLPPMYDWPDPVKRTVLAACTILCVIAYVVMTAGVVGLATLVLSLL